MNLHVFSQHGIRVLYVRYHEPVVVFLGILEQYKIQQVDTNHGSQNAVAATLFQLPGVLLRPVIQGTVYETALIVHLHLDVELPMVFTCCADVQHRFLCPERIPEANRILQFQ